MVKFAVGILAVSAIVGCTLGLGLDLAPLDENGLPEDDRTIIVATGVNSNILGFNLTQLVPLLALASATFLPLLALSALCAFLLWHLLDSKDGYGHQSDYGSSYSQYQRALGLDTLDWEKLSIIDWVALGEETFRKFDPSNLSCQTKLICELHQNAKDFGKLGSSIVNTFGYLRYLELFSLPEIIKGLISEYRDAADRGRELKKDCSDIYTDCEFSVKKLYDRYFS